MNNQQTSGDQLVQLQNIAYIKQFMRRGSVKTLMVVSFLQAFIAGISTFMSKSILSEVMALVLEFAEASGDDISGIENFSSFSSIFQSISGLYAILSIVLGLILPVSLLIIIMRAHSDEPTVIAKGAVKFLHIMSIIQFVISIIAPVVSIFATIITVASGNIEALSSMTSPIVSQFLNCLYYYFLTKFLASIKNSSNGYSLTSTGAKGVGVYSVIFAITCGMALVLLIIVMVIFTSLSSSETVSSNDFWGTLISSGIIETVTPIIFIGLINILLSTIYHISMAVTAFGYRDTVTQAVRASFAAQGNNPYNRANGTTNSPFRTYGGNSVYSNYNYTNSASNGQQSYHNISNNQNTTTVVEENIPENNFVQPNENVYNNTPINNNNDNFSSGNFNL